MSKRIGLGAVKAPSAEAALEQATAKVKKLEEAIADLTRVNEELAVEGKNLKVANDELTAKVKELEEAAKSKAK